MDQDHELEDSGPYRAICVGKNAGLFSTIVALVLYYIFLPLFALFSPKLGSFSYAYDLMFFHGAEVFVFFSNMALIGLWEGGKAGWNVYVNEEDSWEASRFAGMYMIWGSMVAFGLEKSLLEDSGLWAQDWWPIFVTAAFFVLGTGIMASILNYIFAHVFHFFLKRGFTRG